MTQIHTPQLYNQAHYPEHKVHGANMGPTWVLPAPEGLHVGPMNLAIRVHFPLSAVPSLPVIQSRPLYHLPATDRLYIYHCCCNQMKVTPNKWDISDTKTTIQTVSLFRHLPNKTTTHRSLQWATHKSLTHHYNVSCMNIKDDDLETKL